MSRFRLFQMTPKLKLVIGNKNYSSWSMRAWVLRQAGIPFEEIQLKFDENARATGVEYFSPTRQVPVLLLNDAPVWDSLAICETVAEIYPEETIAGASPTARRCAVDLRRNARRFPRAAQRHAHEHSRVASGQGMSEAVQRDITRVVDAWCDCREQCGGSGELLFGHFTVADAYYAPVVMRFMTYDVPLPPVARQYVEAVRALPAVAEWMSAARRETEFVAADEPYAKT